jgi:hypothetical protein
MALTGVWLRANPKIIVSAVKIRELSRYRFPVALFLFHMVLWTIYLISYPYFPNTEPPDAVWHAEITLSVLQGTFTTPIAQAGFAGGAHILFAFVSAYFGVGVIFAERVTAALVESLSVLVAYCLFHRLLRTKLAADYASLAYSIVIPAGLVYYARIGAYPNIIGDFFVLASILLAVLVQRKLTFSSVLTAVLVEGVALVSHVSVVIFAILVIGFSVAVFHLFRSQLRAYLTSNLGFFLFPAVAILAVPFLITRESGYILSNYFQIISTTDLAVYSQVWLHNFLALPGPINFLLLLTGFVWALAKTRKRISPMFLITWFGFLWVLAFFATFSERLILLSFVPGAGLMGLDLAELHETIRRVTLPKIRVPQLRRISLGVLMLGLIIILTVSGPSPLEVSQVFAPGQAARQGQIYDSMVWIQTNTPPNSVVVSVGIPLEYRYLPILTNRTYMGDFQLNSTEILKLQSALHFNYVAVSTGFSGLTTFYASNAFRPAYQNADVVVFVVTT